MTTFIDPERKLLVSGEPVNNGEIFLWALYDLGGDEKFVDVEEVFLKSFEIASQRLAWRTQPDLPDLRRCSKAMRDAEMRTPKLLVKNGPYERRLTAEGQTWIEANFERLAKTLGDGRQVEAPKTRRVSKVLSSLDRSELVETWRDQQTIDGQKWQFAELLQCSPDSANSVWARRLQERRSAAYAADRTDLLEFLDALAASQPEWFG